MSLEKNIDELFLRQGRILTKRREEQSIWYVTPYTPSSSNQLETQIESAAHKVLDKKPFHNLLLSRVKSMKFMKVETVPQTAICPKWYKVIPIHHTLASADALGLAQEVKEGRRCSCCWRVAYDAQCEHELLIDGKFCPEKWSFRWYNDIHWNQIHNTRIPSHMTVANEADNKKADKDDSDNDGDTHNSGFCGDDEVGAPQASAETLSRGEMKTFTSRSVMMSCQSLCNLIQHDKKRIKDACIILETMIKRCQQNLDLVATFGSAGDVLRGAASTCVPGVPQAMVTTVPTTRNLKRIKSTIEQQVSRKKQTTRAMESVPNIGVYSQTSTTGNTKEFEHTAGPMPRQKPTRTCGLCRRQGHKVSHCPFLERFAGSLLPIRRSSSKHVRDQLASDLSEQNKFRTYQRPLGSNEIIHGDFPRRGDHSCIIIHRRLYIDDTRTNLAFADNVCFECTVLQGTLQGVDETYSRKIYSLNAVKFAVTSNQNSLVKSELSFSVENLPMSQSTIDH